MIESTSLWLKFTTHRSKGIPVQHPKGPITNDPWASRLYGDRLHFENENKKVHKEIKALRHEPSLSERNEFIAVRGSEVAFARTAAHDEIIRRDDGHRADKARMKQTLAWGNKAVKERGELEQKTRDLIQKNRGLQLANKSKETAINGLQARLSTALKRAAVSSERAALAMENVSEISDKARAAESALNATARNLVTLTADLTDAQVMPPHYNRVINVFHPPPQALAENRTAKLCPPPPMVHCPTS
jgi:hypothetical protein